MGWEIEEERGGGARWRGDRKGRRQEVGEIERRGGTKEDWGEGGEGGEITGLSVKNNYIKACESCNHPIR